MKARPILFSSPMVRALLDGSKTQTRRIVKSRAKEHMDNIQGILTHAVDIIPKDGGMMIHGDNPTNYDGEVQMNDWSTFLRCPYGQPGDQLWVKENFHLGAYVKEPHAQGAAIAYSVGKSTTFLHMTDDEMTRCRLKPDPRSWAESKTIPCLLMPRWASRITLEITAIRCERLQDISEADAIAEGISMDRSMDVFYHNDTLATSRFREEYGIPSTAPYGARAWYSELWESINGLGSWDANPYVWVVEFRRVEP